MKNVLTLDSANGAAAAVDERVEIQVGRYRFSARFESKLAPKTCMYFRSLLPLSQSVLHCRWSGESLWVPFTPGGAILDFENHTSFPHPGQILIYAHQFSEPEILLPYGTCAFGSKVGQLAGNHFLTIEGGMSGLAELGQDVLWHGAQTISFDLCKRNSGEASSFCIPNRI